MSKPYADQLVWLDLETTGVDETSDSIIELSMIVTEPTMPFAEVATFTSIAVPVLADPFDTTWATDLNEEVIEMHTDNGLFAEIFAVQATPAHSHPTIHVVEGDALTFLEQFGKRLLLAGSGVGHFDRRFLRRHTPRLDARFLYPVLDVGVIRRSFDIIGRKDLFTSAGDATLKTHRGLDDARMHLDEFRYYCGEIFTSIPEVSNDVA